MSVTSSQANIGNTLTDAAALHSLHYTTLNRTGRMSRNLRGPVLKGMTNIVFHDQHISHYEENVNKKILAE